MATGRANRHATVLALGDRGVLIEGASGSGKSLLALSLLSDAGPGRPAVLISDDQAYVRSSAGRLVASAPPATAGLAEARGLGPTTIAHEVACVVDLVVSLVEGDDAPRLDEGEVVVVEGATVRRLRLAAGNVAGAALAVRAALGFSPFLRRS
jgi:serine kinase of HPr protein (carbohydrate metabolism regulator)